MERELRQAGDRVPTAISGFVLAGGSSSRLGRDKVLLPWQGQTLLHHAVDRLQRVCGTVGVCANRNDLRQHLPPSIAIIRDAVAGVGPLGGIVPALESSHTDWNLFLAVDLPLVPVELLQALASFAETDRISTAGTAGVLCILPLVEGLPQPLCGLYRRSLAQGMRRALEEGKYKVLAAVRRAIFEQEATLGTPTPPVKFLDVQSLEMPAQLSSQLKAGEWFLNINTSAELQRARDLSSRQGPILD